jgi:hypothetical protein
MCFSGTHGLSMSKQGLEGSPWLINFDQRGFLILQAGDRSEFASLGVFF